MSKQETFGQFLREARLNAKYGLRQFAREIGWQPSNLSNLEHGRLKPPKDKDTLIAMAEVLGFEEGSNEWNTLFNLAAKDNNKLLPSDIEEFVGGSTAVPILFRTIKDKKLTEEDLEGLIEHIRSHYSD